MTCYVGAHTVGFMTERISTEDLITKPEAARILDKSVRTIDRYLADQTLTPLKYHNGRVVVRRAEVDALLTPKPPVDSLVESQGAFSVGGAA